MPSSLSVWFIFNEHMKLSINVRQSRQSRVPSHNRQTITPQVVFEVFVFEVFVFEVFVFEVFVFEVLGLRFLDTP